MLEKRVELVEQSNKKYQKKVVMKGRRYYLSQLGERLQNPQGEAVGLSDKQLGLVYIDLVLGQSKNNFPSIVRPQEPKIVNIFKKRLQEATRLGLYLLIIDQEIRNERFAEIEMDIHASVKRYAERPRDYFLPGTLEYNLLKLVQNGVDLGKIARTSMEGSRTVKEANQGIIIEYDQLNKKFGDLD